MIGQEVGAVDEPGPGQGARAVPSISAPWSRSADEVVRLLGTEAEGLTSTEAAVRLARWGPNTLDPAAPVSRWRRLAAHFADPIVYLLLVAIVISVVAWWIEGADGIPLDGLVIGVIVVANALLGFVQEHRAESAVAALQTMTRVEAIAVRDGTPMRVDAAEIVVGDVLELAVGDLVAADGRLVEATNLRVAEASLTGESAPVAKGTEPTPADTVLGDRTTMTHSGTAIVAGRGRAVVTATGPATEVGRIATLLGQTESDASPLREEIDQVGRLLGMAVVAIAVAVVVTLLLVAGRWTGEIAINALLIGVSLAVAAVPEGLPAVLTVVLALGVQRMSTRKALIKRLASVETLGSATVICSDKTGTLTRNEMVARRLVTASGMLELAGGRGAGSRAGDGGLRADGRLVTGGDQVDEARWALTVGGLASSASTTDRLDRPTGPQGLIGDPTETALVEALATASVDWADVSARYRRVGEVPFSSERKRMSTLIVEGDDPAGLPFLAVKGAPDVLIERCRSEYVGSEVVALTPERTGWWRQATDELARHAFRTLAIAYRPASRLPHPVDEEDADELERELVMVAVVGIIDPPREEARQAVEEATSAGIRVAMITGDHPETARRIAHELGIADGDRPVVTAPDIDDHDDDQLAELAQTASVYARVTPEQKLRIVQALRARSEIVAMTGDGVNDAPALKAADIGVAMGVTGTDVSKEAADMILADDNFATIVAAVTEGRAIFHNIRSFLRYLLSSNIGEVFTVFGGVLAASAIGLTAAGAGAGAGAAVSPLLAVQILWLNLVTDAAPALALGVDPPARGLMTRRPRRPTDRVIDRRMQGGILLVGATMALAALTMVDLALPGGVLGGSGDITEARTGAFTVLVIAQLFNTFNARSDTQSAFQNLSANPWLLGAVALSALLQVAVVHLSFLNGAFGTTPLSPTDWLTATALASSVIWVTEGRKYLLRRRTPTDLLD